MNDPRLRVGLMAKYWTPGHVKTRLAATIGPDRAAMLHRFFVFHLCKSLATAGDIRELVVTPRSRMPEFEREPIGPWTIVDQGEGNLGERMASWFQRAFRRPPRTESSTDLAVLIGADCPDLGRAEIDVAKQALDTADVVLGPAVDGGYYLIGMRSPWNAKTEVLFRDIPWSTRNVLKLTVEQANRCGLAIAFLETREDIDTASELNRLRNRLAVETAQSPDRDELLSGIERIMNAPFRRLGEASSPASDGQPRETSATDASGSPNESTP